MFIHASLKRRKPLPHQQIFAPKMRFRNFPAGAEGPRAGRSDLWQVFARVKSVCFNFIYSCQRKSIMEKTWPLRRGAHSLDESDRPAEGAEQASKQKHLRQQKLHRHLIQTNVDAAAAVVD
jgi:hypothetical protein